MKGIQVSDDGFVHCGNNEWFSLDRIQQAVLAKQNPGLQTNSEGCQCRQRMTINVEQEHLEHPTTLVRKPKRHRRQQETRNVGQEHLPLPTTNVRKS
jgi:hypothetical protein